jgi:glc operon protein GlcG
MPDRLLTRANHACAHAILAARDLGLDVAVVVVDKGGHIVAAQRRDLCGYPPVETARRKASTAAVLGAPTALLATFVWQDPIAARALEASPDMLAVPGGAPLVLDGLVMGGIGVAGARYDEDQLIVERALEALAAAQNAESAR